MRSFVPRRCPSAKNLECLVIGGAQSHSSYFSHIAINFFNVVCDQHYLLLFLINAWNKSIFHAIFVVLVARKELRERLLFMSCTQPEHSNEQRRAKCEAIP